MAVEKRKHLISMSIVCVFVAVTGFAAWEVMRHDDAQHVEFQESQPIAQISRLAEKPEVAPLEWRIQEADSFFQVEHVPVLEGQVLMVETTMDEGDVVVSLIQDGSEEATLYFKESGLREGIRTISGFTDGMVQITVEGSHIRNGTVMIHFQ